MIVVLLFKISIYQQISQNQAILQRVYHFSQYLVYDKHQRVIYRSNHQRCSVRKGVVKNFPKFTGNTCVRVSFLIKLQASGRNFAKFLRTRFLRNTSGRLLLYLEAQSLCVIPQSEIRPKPLYFQGSRFVQESWKELRKAKNQEKGSLLFRRNIFSNIEETTNINQRMSYIYNAPSHFC